MFAERLETLDYLYILHIVSNIDGLINVKSPVLETELG